MKTIFTMLSLCAMLNTSLAATPAEPVKVLYHLNEAGFAQVLRTINFVNNHVASDPSVKIVVLAQSDGVFFLSAETRNENGIGFTEAVAQLQKKGVQFEVCNISLLSRGIRVNQLIPGVKIVQSGVVELARLQSVEHFAYIRP